LIEGHPLDFPFKIQIPDWRLRLTEAMGIPRIGWKKRPKVENIIGDAKGEKERNTYA
jgi:hypothetical protein